MSAAPTFAALVKTVRPKGKEATPFPARHFRLVGAVLAAAQLGIAEDPEKARRVLGECWRRLAVACADAGINHPNECITPLRWQHRPPDPDRAAWLESTSRLISHAELLSTLCGSVTQGTTHLETATQPLLGRYDAIMADLLTLHGGLKLSPRECAEAV